MNPVPRFNVLGVGVSALTLAQTMEMVIGVRGRLKAGYICHATVHSISEARRDPAFRRVLNGSWLTTPDGMPLVWLAHRLGHPAVNRVYGPDLLLAVCDAGRAGGLRHYFFGGAPGVADALASRLASRFPGLAIAGTESPPYRPMTAEEFTALQVRIAAAQADVVWVGLGTPKQDRFMAESWQRLDAGVLIGVGAAFDFHSGRLRQAPRWMQRCGLEWLFRLFQEPRRLAVRYLVYNPLFVARALAQLSGLKRYPLD
ncbi:MAG: WecB/TagA/CpsF family glycosyltransferase [Opitutaceae bacterium]|nr:WecB/TagA/CpsF family glycosyltransferase [Opitutaceae bacterium]